MKTSEFTKYLKKCGCRIKRHGAEHDIWYNPETGGESSVHRHQAKEIPTGTINRIKKDLGLK